MECRHVIEVLEDHGPLNTSPHTMTYGLLGDEFFVDLFAHVLAELDVIVELVLHYAEQFLETLKQLVLTLIWSSFSLTDSWNS